MIATKLLPGRRPAPSWRMSQVEEVVIKGPSRETTCTNKKAFGTKAEADAAAYSLLSARRDVCKAYKCSFGDHWHIGHPLGTKRGRLAR